eukprot:2657649-Pyramimonas_sp.AAC.1
MGRWMRILAVAEMVGVSNRRVLAVAETRRAVAQRKAARAKKAAKAKARPRSRAPASAAAGAK